MIVDASVWVSSLLPRDVHHSVSSAWLVQQGLRGVSFVVPTLALAEVAGAVARITRSSVLGRHAAQMIARRPRIRFVNLDDSVAHEAAQLAADQRLRGADAVYVAVAQRLNLPLVTWDLDMVRRGPASVDVRTPGPAF